MDEYELMRLRERVAKKRHQEEKSALLDALYGRDTPVDTGALYISSSDASEELGINISTVRAWVDHGYMPRSRRVSRGAGGGRGGMVRMLHPGDIITHMGRLGRDTASLSHPSFVKEMKRIKSNQS